MQEPPPAPTLQIVLSYQQKLDAWKRSHGLQDEEGDDFSPGEVRMIAEDSDSTGTSYCWMCGRAFPIRELVLELSPYNQMTDDIAEDGYIAAVDRVRKCKPCVDNEVAENRGEEPAEHP